MNNVIIIGSGPAGHTAAMYLARANLHPLMLEGDFAEPVASGGLLTTTKMVENFPGFPEGINGLELTENFRNQSLKYGTKIISESASQIKKNKDKTFTVITTEHEYKTKAILIATGANPKHLTVPGYSRLWQKGVSTCAVCDGALYKKVPVAVVGGGDSACEEALHLTYTASIVYLIHRRDKLRASKTLTDRVLSNPNIQMIWNTEVSEILGKDRVESVDLSSTTSKRTKNLQIRALFVAIGHIPNTKFLDNFIKLDDEKFIITKSDLSTSKKGIWAAGDVQDRKYRQAITAAGSGCVAALEIEKWLE
jgi:thioredoxin reductase (NADPH)